MDILSVWYDSLFNDPIMASLALYVFVKLGFLLNGHRTRANKVMAERDPNSILVVDLRTLHRHPTIVAAATSIWTVLNKDVKTILTMEVW
jgi:hypothetical protein